MLSSLISSHPISCQVCCLGSEAINPKKNLPRAVVGVLAIVTVLYVLASLALVGMQNYVGKIRMHYLALHYIMLCRIAVTQTIQPYCTDTFYATLSAITPLRSKSKTKLKLCYFELLFLS